MFSSLRWIVVLVVLIGMAVTKIERYYRASTQPKPIAAMHPILGSWRYDFPDLPCFESASYRVDGTRSGTAYRENLLSAFEISETPDAKGYYHWTDTVIWANGQPDCRGQETPVGDVAKGRLLFNADRTEFTDCIGENSGRCWGPYRRIRDVTADGATKTP